MKWHTYLGMFLLGISSAFAATPTNLVIQRVGINVTAPDQLKEIGLFLQQGVIGAVDRTTTHIIDASPEAINTLQIKKLSAITSLVLSQNQDTVVISLVFIDSQGTNDLPRFASFPLSNWMNSLSPAIANISREIASRYPPRPVSMLSTIDVVKTYSPYEVLSNEITIVAGIGYAGTSYKYTGTMNNDHFDVPAMSTSTGPAVDLLLRWRYRKWYNEGWIQSMFSQSPTVLASFSMGYGLLGGVITPLIGGLFSYQEVSFVIKISNITTNLEKKIYFTRGEIMPLFGIRVAFQPTFWVTFFLAPPPLSSPSSKKIRQINFTRLKSILSIFR